MSYANKGLSGLANLGNTCYLNSCMQVLSHTYELNDLLAAGTFKSQIKNNPEAIVLQQWDKLRSLLWQNNCVVAPYGFVRTIQQVAQAKQRDLFNGFAQNDVQEFLLFIIECFHNAVARQVTMNVAGTPTCDQDQLAIKCLSMMKTYFSNDYSEIISLFYGIQVSAIVSQGNVFSQIPEAFSVLNLPMLQTKPQMDLLDCFQTYCVTEQLTGPNAWYNDETKQHQDATKTIRFWSLPEVLIIDLKRWSSMNGRKLQALVTFPLTDLNLAPFVVGYRPESFVYDLYGVCNHAGNVLGGHYTANIRNANGQWYNFNDTRVSAIQPSQVVSVQAYCLFYRKKKSIA